MIRALFVIISASLFWELLTAGLAIAAAAVIGGLGPALAAGAVCAALKSYERAT